MNALAHTVAGLVARLPDGSGDFLNYTNDADQFTAAISRYPFIILKAKNSNQLATLRKSAAEVRIAHNVFVSSMLGHSADDQMAKTRTAAGPDLEYWVVALFGSADLLNPITKRFSLFTGPTLEGGQ
jgi:hypothetical protein